MQTVFTLLRVLGGTALFIGFIITQQVWAQDSEPKTIPISEEEKKFLKSQAIETPYQYIEAANFKSKLGNGTPVELSKYKGNLVFLNFWATWCAPCLKELPDMEKLHQKLGKKGLIILAVGMGENEKKIKNFLKKYDFTFPMVIDPDMKISHLYGVQNIPVTYLIEPGGAIIARAIGPREWANPELMRYFQKKVSSHP